VATESLVGFPYYEEFMARVEQTGLTAGVSPVVKSYALISLDGRPEEDVEIVGLDPVQHSQATNFGQTLRFHQKDVKNAFVPDYDPNAPGCIPGIDRDPVMRRDARGHYPQFTGMFMRSVTLTCFPLTAKGMLARAGTTLVSTKSFSYSDYSHSGLARMDDGYVYLPLQEAQGLCMDGEPRITSLHIKFRPGVGEVEGCRRIAELWEQFKQDKAGAPNSRLLNTASVQGWREYRRGSIAPMEQEQLILGLMFVLVGITTVFIVFVVFYMIVNNKRKDIGVLKSVGASNVGVLSLFQGFAFGIGFLGSCAGVLLAWLFLARINQTEQWCYTHLGIQLWDRTIYVIGDIPHQVELSVLAVIVLFAILACQFGALVPSYLAVRLRPVETLHAGRT
jgi:hypothetical protein